MISRAGETWKFEVRCPGAERVYLVREAECGSSAWIEMRPIGRGDWEITHRLGPGRYRFRYFRADGMTYLNCGSHGLSGRCVDGADGSVEVEAMEYAMPA